MTQTLKEKLSVKDKWFRLIFMILFVIIMWIARCIVGLIAIVQFIYVLFAGIPLKALLPFSESISSYIYQIIQFLTYLTEDKPFPFKAWPSSSAKKTQ